MADGSSVVLREYLVALGWSIDQEGAKKFDKRIQATEKTLNGLARVLASVGAATTAMVATFAYNMEKLYYASKRVQSSVGNIQALQFGAEQIGISGETMLASLEGMAKSIRNNPGILALIKSFGIQVEGRDMSDVMRDTVKVLAQMPHFVGAQFAAMFGMDEQTFLHMKQNMGELEAAVERRKQMAADMGVDADAAALASKELLNSWRAIVEQVGLFKDALAIALLPALKQVADVTQLVLKDWMKILNGPDQPNANVTNTFGARWRDGIRAMLGLGPMRGGGVELTPEARARTRISSGVVTEDPGKAVPTIDERAARLAKLAELEKRYSLPSGLLSRVWKAESNEGKDMLSPAGAKGHFQFMDATAAEYGLADPNDFLSSADAAARYYRNLLQQHGGDARMAAAAYNWGPGNLAKYGIGQAPAETRAYMDKVAGPAQIQQKTDIHVSGVSSPQEAARLVLDGQQRVNADLVRNLGGSSR